ncbi:KR domain-containing protein [Xylariaceae sp. FL0804]|nr:KR domain-containing protein [Xylariaceae sp. FL0804]
MSSIQFPVATGHLPPTFWDSWDSRFNSRPLKLFTKKLLNDFEAELEKNGSAGDRCKADRGDVADVEDVARAFRDASKPVAGVIQGAMVLQDKPSEMMTHREHHEATRSQVAGTWNLHNAAADLGLRPDFSTTLSSISGLVGQPAQANYAAADVFLDNFASYRRGLGLQAKSVSLGAIDGAGFMAEHSELIAALDTSAWTPINEAPVPAHLPQAPASRLLADARFSSLPFGASAGGAGLNKEIQALNRSRPGKPLDAYGLDALAAVEFSHGELTTLEVTGAPSLLSLAEKIVTKLQAASRPAGQAVEAVAE